MDNNENKIAVFKKGDNNYIYTNKLNITDLIINEKDEVKLWDKDKCFSLYVGTINKIQKKVFSERKVLYFLLDNILEGVKALPQKLPAKAFEYNNKTKQFDGFGSKYYIPVYNEPFELVDLEIVILDEDCEPFYLSDPIVVFDYDCKDSIKYSPFGHIIFDFSKYKYKCSISNWRIMNVLKEVINKNFKGDYVFMSDKGGRFVLLHNVIYKNKSKLEIIIAISEDYESGFKHIEQIEGENYKDVKNKLNLYIKDIISEIDRKLWIQDTLQ
jgi:hypothetical protein